MVWACGNERGNGRKLMNVEGRIGRSKIKMVGYD